MPPASEVIDIACHAQQRVEASVPAPPAVSRTPSSSSLQQQLVPESTRHTIEMVLSSTAQSPSKLLQFGRSVIGQKLSGLSGGWHKPAQTAVDESVLYRPSDIPSPGGSFEHLVAPANSKASSVSGSNIDIHNGLSTGLGQTDDVNDSNKVSGVSACTTDINNGINNAEESAGDQPTEVNLIDLSFEDSGGDNLISFTDNEAEAIQPVPENSTVNPEKTLLDDELIVNPEKTLDSELTVADDQAENQSTVTSQSDISSGPPPAILLNDAETSSGMRADRPLCRRQSLLKMSRSDSSLSVTLSTAPPAPQTATSADDLHAMRDLDALDDDADLASASALGGVSGFSRLLQGGKLAASLMVPRGSSMSVAAAASRHRQLEELAKTRLAKSQLRFKECRTRIILL